MLIIADSGSTKADWTFILKSEEQISLSTKGFNPVFHSSEDVSNTLLASFEGKIPLEEEAVVYYYGSGCSSEALNDIIKKGLEVVFPNWTIMEVAHDLLGAARAACGSEAGIACILGTGSNSCYYDGANTADNVPSLGYILGDEGSGSYLGRMFIKSYFYREMPADLCNIFERMHPGGKDEIVTAVYNGNQPNVYLASHAKILSDNREHPFVKSLVKKGLNDFITSQVLKYPEATKLPINFIGSIAFYFKAVLKEVLKENGLTLGIIIKKPIFNLVKYHIDLLERFD